MITINDLVEDWIEIRSKLQHQLKALDSGELRTGAAAIGHSTEGVKIQIRKWVDELNALLKKYSNIPPT